MAWKFNPFTSKQDYYKRTAVLPSITIDFDTADPNTPGTIFTPDDQLNTDALYISDVNNSQWTSDGISYQTFTPPPATPSTPFYLNGTTIDAGSNKTAMVYRNGGVAATVFNTKKGLTNTGASNNNKWFKVFDYLLTSNYIGDSFKLQMNEYNTGSGVGKSIVFNILVKRQDPSTVVNVNVESGLSSFDLANFDVLYNSTTKRLAFYYKVTTTFTVTNWLVLNARATTTSEILWSNTLIGTSLSGQTSNPLTIKIITLNKVNGAYTLPSTAPTTGQVLGYSSAGVSDWVTSSAGITGSGTNNYVAKWTPDGATLGNSLIQDDGVTAGIGVNDAGFLFTVSSHLVNYAFRATSSLIGGLGTVAGTFQSLGNGTGPNKGIYVTAANNTNYNIAGHFVASTNDPCALWLQDGTEAMGKVLTCITADGKANWVTPSSSSGVCGIANSSGVYTYYATLSLAITAATSGQTVDILTDITETGSVTITTKAGVKINGNGYTYTLSVNDATHAITVNSYLVELFNWKVVRTGRANTSTGNVLNGLIGPVTLKCYNVVFENTYGSGVQFYGSIYGLTINSYYTCAYQSYDDLYLYNCTFTSTNLSGVSSVRGEVFNSIITALTDAISSPYNSFNLVSNSVGRSTGSGVGISAIKVTNSTGISSSGTGISSTNGYNCVGISTSGVGLSGTFTNSTGVSTSGYAGSGGTKTNCTLMSSSNYGSFQENLNNCYLESATNVPLWSSSSKLINSCTALCLWNNVGGHAINTTSASTGVDIRNCNLTVTNASAYCINGAVGSTFKYASNTYKGSTTAVNATNITQGITNTSDNQGNILI